MRRMSGVVLPRPLSTVLVAADEAGVHVTFTGEPSSPYPVEFFSYAVVVTGNRGSTLKQFGLKFVGAKDPEVFAYVSEILGASQANYPIEQVTIGDDAITVHYVDATLGAVPVDSIYATMNVLGADVQDRVPVTLVEP